MFAANEREALTALLNRAAAERGRVSDYIRLGTYAAQMGNVDEAQQALITAAKLDAGATVRPQLALADFYGSIGATDKQVRRLRMAYAIEPANDDLLKKIREAGEIPGPTFGIAPDDTR
jgi:predicted TPR repeat methyltransferase